MIQISSKAKVKVHWKTTPYDYDKEKEKEIQVLFAKKYNIPNDNVKVVPDFILPNLTNGGNILSEVTTDNIQDPAFHKKLFMEYLKVNEIKDYDFEYITKIDDDINSKIDYLRYDKYRRFSIKWIKWSNFQSYGADNSFDFTNLNGLVLLNGEPANQSGKTTFAVDLLHFLLFGKSGKWDKLEGLFNYRLPEETEMCVEGCITLDGEDYIIKRKLTRPALAKRTPTSKINHTVEYYRLINGNMESLDDYVEENGEDARQTNKIIKESIGREDDFDLMMCITGSNLDDLIDEKPTERGRLFSRWIGLLPLEEKDAFAREKFNQTIKPTLLSNRYNRETLKSEIEAYKIEITECEKRIKEFDKICKDTEKDIAALEKTKNDFILNKQKIDDNILKIDITTLRSNFERKKNEGIEKKKKCDDISLKLKEIGTVEFSVEEYDKIVEDKTKKLLTQQDMRTEAKRLQELIKQLQTSEYCPVCKRKFDNVDNSQQIKETQTILDNLIVKGKAIGEEIKGIETKIETLKVKREQYQTLNKLTTQKAALEVSLANLRNECIELRSQENEYKKNSEAIDKNNKLDISIRNTEASIISKREARDHNFQQMTQNKANIEEYKKNITERETIIQKINEEEKVVYNWKLYLEMVGKNGISKMVMRNALPIINARITQLLEDVCDFDVNIEINNKNEVTFNIIRDGITKSLSSGSGFELTASALALRSVLADVSNISRMNFLVLDEILGRVASENYDNMFTLYERISKGYDFVFHITHIDSVKDWHSHIVTVVKDKKGVSTLKELTNKPKQATVQTEKKTTKGRKKKAVNDTKHN